MEVKTSELIGPALDWAVARAGGWDYTISRSGFVIVAGRKRFTPSTNWTQGGPIIEHENITAARDGDICDAYKREFLFEEDGRDAYQKGPTMLVAAMRCYVTSKLGTEVDVPEELL